MTTCNPNDLFLAVSFSLFALIALMAEYCSRKNMLSKKATEKKDYTTLLRGVSLPSWWEDLPLLWL